MHAARSALLAAAAAVLLAAPPARADDVFATATTPASGSEVSPRFFGAHIGYLVARPGRRGGKATAWPAVPVAGVRLWDSALRWADIQPQRDTLSFERFDAFVGIAASHGAEVVYTLGSPPAWASARPTEKCPYGVGCSAAPADMADWERYVRTVAQRYKGRIAVYELWNEPKFYAAPPDREVQGFFSGSVDEMMQMARIARRVLKEVDPAALLASPGFDGGTKWLETFLAAGGGPLVDIIAYHFYARDTREMAGQIVAVRAAMKRNGVGNLPLWNTESGFEARDGQARSADGKDRPTRDQAAGMLAQSMVLAAAADVRRFYAYAWEHVSMGMVDADGAALPNLQAYGSVARWISGATLRGCAQPQADVVVCRGERGANRFAIAWSLGSPRTWSMPLARTAKDAAIETLAGGRFDAAAGDGGAIDVALDATPVLVRWTEAR